MRAPLGLLLALAAACASTPAAPELAPSGPVVAELRVRGNESVSDAAIRGAIATQETTRFLFFGSVHRLDPGALAQDLRRIRDLYEERGFYAARVEAAVNEVAPDEVEVEFRVQEGPPTILRSLLIQGLDRLSPAERAAILDDPPLERGDRLVEKDWIEWKEEVLERLRERGFARASVDARIEIAPAQGSADAILVVDTGPRFRFGQVTIVGNQLVPEDRIRVASEAALEPGDRYAPSRMKEAQEEVFDLGVFAAVNVTDRISDEAAGDPAAREEPAAGFANDAASSAVAPVVIAVSEADFLRLRVGAGVGIDQSYYQARALAEITHLNLFGGLQNLRFSNELAYRLINPGAEVAGESGPAGVSTLTFTQPDFWGSRVDFLARIEYERALRPAYSAQSITGRIGTPIRLRRGLHVVPSYNVTRFFDVSVFDEGLVDPVVPGVRPSLVGDCPEGCTLSWLEQQVVLDRRDDPLEPHAGWYAALGLQEGGIGGDFAWLRLTPQVRGYLPLSDALVLAGRLELGWLHPLSTCDPEQARDPYLDAVECSPIVVRFFGGGADGFRGAGADLLSPFRTVRSGGRLRFIPLGGNGSLLASTELRWYFAPSWSSAFFLDAGNVAETAAETFAVDNLQLALGAGVRFRTPIGPVRLDVGYRLLRDPLEPVGGGAPFDRGTLDDFAIFLSLGEAF